jgi:hypothetical protein
LNIHADNHLAVSQRSDVDGGLVEVLGELLVLNLIVVERLQRLN